MFLSSDEMQTVQEILEFYAKGLEVWAFGSRVTGKNLKKFSDLDLVIIDKTPLPIRQYAQIKDAFTLSDLPFRVDVLDWTTISPEFRKIIEENYKIIQTATA